MELTEAINRRTSVRYFKDEIPSRATIDALLAAAIRAPSAGNLQPWRFYVVWNSSLRRKLASAAGSQKHVALAPVVIVICVEPGVSASRYGERGRNLYCLQDAAAAAQNLLLAAVDHGLGGCWVGAFDEDVVARLTGCGPEARPIIMVPLGFPAGPYMRTPRFSLGRIVEQLD